MNIEPLRDSSRWKVTILPHPKRLLRNKAFGFCGGFPAGEAYGQGYGQTPVWWKDDEPQILQFPGQKRLVLRNARGRTIPGSFEKGSGENGGAIAWELNAQGSLDAKRLHPDNYVWSAAIGTGNGAVCGYGQPKGKKGAEPPERALFWRADGKMIELESPDGGEGLAEATDGEMVVGHIRQRAACWRSDGSLAFLGQNLSRADGVWDGIQVGGTTKLGKTIASRAALWKGSAETLVDLTPEGFEEAMASGCGPGFQVGHVKKKSLTRNGSASMANRAALWAGSAASFLDLHDFVPQPYNASYAIAVEVEGTTLRIAGVADRYVVSDELTPRESHYGAEERAILWQASLG